MNHSVLTLSHFVCALRLPVRHSLETSLTRCPQRILLDEALVVVGNLLPGMTQVLHVRLGGRGEWRAWGLGILMPGVLQTDEVARRGWSQQLGVSERPLGTKLGVQSTEELRHGQDRNGKRAQSQNSQNRHQTQDIQVA